MDSIDTELAARIRQDIILGAYEEGERLSEARLCETHRVSRTPVRLALRMLEREGVVRRGKGRGYLVQSPTVHDIIQAMEVRGHLESLAARLMAQSPKRELSLPAMESAIEETDRLIDAGVFDDAALRRTQQQNALFHMTILDGCGNDFVSFSCSRISHLPMLQVGSMAFDKRVSSTPDDVKRTHFRLSLGNAQHKVICEAIQLGDGVRAEGMMREHSRTMVECIQSFERLEGVLTVADLVAYSTGDPLAPVSLRR
ncbi:MAG: GntR family transcriptional regulator [Boseongicola sp. SB0664_bin_43]|uniref:GntR family transcriptional regulator n=1 Tax=Boseongicola sp. SB0664_bin_43 TaxID=2604844 RepID=A0A6B0Y1S4_9RHOB|nr:GntR family transcriptional regulator [Boseongicola sp. SB0664_bin_43]